MALWYGIWLWMGGAQPNPDKIAIFTVTVGFAPLLLWALYDFRYGLLFTVLATPLLIAPIIPKSFTQGFGDWFAICSILGFLLRNPHPYSWRVLWRCGYGWLIFILMAGILSLLVIPSLGQEMHYGVKYGIAEILGYCLDFAYLVILVNEIRSKCDFKVVIYALLTAFMVVMAYSLVGIVMSLFCVGDYYGPRTALTSNQSISSTFGSSNYHAAYLLMILPLGFFFYFRSARGKSIHYLIAICIILTVLFIQASLSRSALLGLIMLALAWLIITQLKKGTRLLSTVLVLMLLSTFIIWWYPHCKCPDAPKGSLDSLLGFMIWRSSQRIPSP